MRCGSLGAQNVRNRPNIQFTLFSGLCSSHNLDLRDENEVGRDLRIDFSSRSGTKNELKLVRDIKSKIPPMKRSPYPLGTRWERLRRSGTSSSSGSRLNSASMARKFHRNSRDIQNFHRTQKHRWSCWISLQSVSA